jgi:hypothetical protein
MFNQQGDGIQLSYTFVRVVMVVPVEMTLKGKAVRIEERDGHWRGSMPTFGCASNIYKAIVT